MSAPDCLDESKLSIYLDGGLDGDAVSDVEKHLAHCKKCEAVYQSLRHVDELLSKELLTLEPPEEMERLLERRILQSRNERAPRQWGWKQARLIGYPHAWGRVWAPVSAFSLIVILIFGTQQFQSFRNERKLLAEIDRFKIEIGAEVVSRNPFDIDGQLPWTTGGNPFQEYSGLK